MKKCLVIIITLSCLHFGACRRRETYRFLNATDKIANISIVTISFDENGRIEQTEVQRVDDIDGFLNDFRSVACYTYFGDPIGVTQKGIEDTVIRVQYTNDEYELINWKGQSEYTQERGFSYYAGFNVFDEKQFESLIEAYFPQ